MPVSIRGEKKSLPYRLTKHPVQWICMARPNWRRTNCLSQATPIQGAWHTLFGGTLWQCHGQSWLGDSVFLSIKDSGVLTITDPHMTRFMISLEQGVELVWHAFEDMVGGEHYVKKSSMTMPDLATAVSATAEQKIIGIRPGEKLHEQMISAEDSFIPTNILSILKSCLRLMVGMKRLSVSKMVLRCQKALCTPVIITVSGWQLGNSKNGLKPTKQKLVKI